MVIGILVEKDQHRLLIYKILGETEDTQDKPRVNDKYTQYDVK